MSYYKIYHKEYDLSVPKHYPYIGHNYQAVIKFHDLVINYLDNHSEARKKYLKKPLGEGECGYLRILELAESEKLNIRIKK